MEVHQSNVNKKQEHILDELNVRQTPIPNEDFFAQMKSVVQEKAFKQEVKIVPFYKKWHIMVAAAASIVLIISVALRSGETVPIEHQKPDFASLTKEDVIHYVENNLPEFEAEQLAEHIQNIPVWEVQKEITTSKDLAQTTSKKQDLFKQIDREDVLDYLEEELIDVDEDLLLGS